MENELRYQAKFLFSQLRLVQKVYEDAVAAGIKDPVILLLDLKDAKGEELTRRSAGDASVDKRLKKLRGLRFPFLSWGYALTCLRRRHGLRLFQVLRQARSRATTDGRGDDHRDCRRERMHCDNPPCREGDGSPSMTPRITTLADEKTDGGYTIGAGEPTAPATTNSPKGRGGAPRDRVVRLLAQINHKLACQTQAATDR